MQVCSYRCIVSHESSKFSDFSLCVLQKHNCLGLAAQPPALPNPPPMTSFRGQPMTHDLAEQLFIGWLGEQPTFSPSLFLRLFPLCCVNGVPFSPVHMLPMCPS
jgi:hypothetical protein